ncbi:MAG: hypothetical protein GF401_16760 [Chitinivibrionales bacterium]|nr:hypothetical protein [Chitinivibrionales bacterium]
MALIQCVSVLATIKSIYHCLAGFGIIIAIIACQYFAEKKLAPINKSSDNVACEGISHLRLNGVRFGALILYLAFLGTWAKSHTGSLLIGNACAAIADYTIIPGLVNKTGAEKLLPGIMGLLLVVNEVNILFRLVFDLFSIAHPGRQKDQIVDENGEGEYNNGRLIGILERIIIYFLVIINKYEAIGFIMAAKAFARFKELDNRLFAEYVLN